MSVDAAGCGVWAVVLPWRGYLFMRLLFVDNQALYMQVVIALAATLVVAYEWLLPHPGPSPSGRGVQNALMAFPPLPLGEGPGVRERADCPPNGTPCWWL
ncbi:hypothetical protein [Spirosoma montaniterrae]|uniref:hypothetical protein n=1 Tax=Spirosoma montaniterrae TaxID=1178516 RepID=UPI0012F7414E|nr:hypothetical protein [Spirosoma montaniterrae]